MKKYIILTIALLVGISFAYAQDEDDGKEYGAKKGAITVAMKFGRSPFMDAASPPPAPANNINWTVSGSAPYAGTVSGYNDSGNIIGAEVRYFITDVIAVKVSGGAITRNTPAFQNVQYFYINNSSEQFIPGNDPNSPNAAWIPQYGSVVAENNVQTFFNIGGEYHFPSPLFNRLFPYVGANFNFNFVRNSAYDPTISYSSVAQFVTTDGASYTEGSYSTTGISPFPYNAGYVQGGSPGGDDGFFVPEGSLIYDVGVRSTLMRGLGAQAVAGFDIYIIPGVYAGIETIPISMIYTWNAKYPGPGLPALEAENTTWSFFAQTSLKVGIIIASEL
jgi:hypothetical protein